MHNEENQKDKEELKNKIPSIFALNEFFITKSSSFCVVVTAKLQELISIQEIFVLIKKTERLFSIQFHIFRRKTIS